MNAKQSAKKNREELIRELEASDKTEDRELAMDMREEEDNKQIRDDEENEQEMEQAECDY